MKTFFWLLLKAAIFFLLFAFAIGNRHEAMLYFLPGQAITVPMVVIVLACFTLGVCSGILVMVPRWWRLRRATQQAEQHAAASAAADEAQLLPHTPAPHPAELARHMTDPSITSPYES